MILTLSVFLIISGAQRISMSNSLKDLQAKYDELLTLYENAKTTYEEEIAPCPLCGTSVKILPINEAFHIRCETCNLQTDFFASKQELIAYWNHAGA